MPNTGFLREKTSQKEQLGDDVNQLINITIPVFNEERALADSVQTVLKFTATHLDNPCEIVIANNASTDSTADIAFKLQGGYPNVRVVNLKEQGRGRALKRAWADSKADILTYMDCDLSTDLSCFKGLVAPLIAGTHALSIGSRLLPHSVTKRGFKRSFISRSYNRLIHALFKVQFSDAQCGFKAITKQAFTMIHPLIKDGSWFMDTELLLIADRLGYRIFDLPVHWTDDPDSKVKILKTAFEDVKGLLRLRWNFLSGRIRSTSHAMRMCGMR
jgi:glycosyltransferase involved in cell wall biosynthesis